MAGQVLTRRVLIVLGLLTAAPAAGAQARLTGVTRDSTGAPLQGVEVSVQGVQRMATTGRDGTFSFAGLDTGTTTVSARRLGYAAQATILRLVAGDNKLPPIIMLAVAAQLDTVTSRVNQLWRERPLLREMEENRRIGLGQFITAAELRKNQGGFISPMVSQMRGLVVIRGANPMSPTWLANRYVPYFGPCYELEDRNGALITPRTARGANCDYCFPTSISTTRRSRREESRRMSVAFTPTCSRASRFFLALRKHRHDMRPD